MNTPNPTACRPDIPWLMVIGAGHVSVPILKRAAQLGYRTWICDRDRGAPGSAFAHHFTTTPRENQDALQNEALAFAHTNRVEGCLTASTAPGALRAAAVIREALHLPGPTSDVTEVCLDRPGWKDVVSRQGIRTPASITAQSPAEITHFRRYAPNFVLKPEQGGRGASGIFKVSPQSQPQSQWEPLFSRTAEISDSRRVLAEEWIVGDEMSVDCFVQNGLVTPLQIARKFVRHIGGRCEPLGYAWGRPARSDRADQMPGWNALLHLAQQVAKALSIENTCFTLDAILPASGGTPVLIDLGLLLDAKVDSALRFNAVDIDGLHCTLAAGLSPDLTHDPGGLVHGFATRFWYAEQAGRLRQTNQHHRRGHGIAAEGPDPKFQIEWECAEGAFVKPSAGVADLVVSMHRRDEHAEAAWHAASATTPSSLFSVTAASPARWP